MQIKGFNVYIVVFCYIIDKLIEVNDCGSSRCLEFEVEDEGDIFFIEIDYILDFVDSEIEVVIRGDDWLKLIVLEYLYIK